MLIKKIMKDSISLDTYKLLGSFLQCIQSQHVKYNDKYKNYISKDCVEDIKEYLKDKNTIVYVFFNERIEEIGGMAIVRKDKDDYHISELYVCPKYRGKGLGKKFVRMIIKQCLNYVTLRVHLKNSIALKLYKGLGFTWLDKVSCPFGSRRMIWKVKGSGRDA